MVNETRAEKVARLRAELPPLVPAEPEVCECGHVDVPPGVLALWRGTTEVHRREQHGGCS